MSGLSTTTTLCLVVAITLCCSTHGVGADDVARCVSIVNTVQQDFKAMLGEPDATARLQLADRLAARFTTDGVMADPAWRPNSGHDTIAKAEAGTYLPVPRHSLALLLETRVSPHLLLHAVYSPALLVVAAMACTTRTSSYTVPWMWSKYTH